MVLSQVFQRCLMPRLPILEGDILFIAHHTHVARTEFLYHRCTVCSREPYYLTIKAVDNSPTVEARKIEEDGKQLLSWPVRRQEPC